jgi:hypothetical protein
MKKLAKVVIILATLAFGGVVKAGEMDWCGAIPPAVSIDEASAMTTLSLPVFRGAPIQSSGYSWVLSPWIDMAMRAYDKEVAVHVRYDDTNYHITSMQPSRIACVVVKPTITATAQNQAVAIAMEGMPDAGGVLRYSLVQVINNKWENLYTGNPVTFSGICVSNAQTQYDVRFVIVKANGSPMDEIPGTALVGLVKVCNTSGCAYELDPAVGKAACGK